MCTKTLFCPLCCQPNFSSVDALRLSLLKVTSRPLKCPICSDELLGLDKLTIHLFGHTILEEPPPAEGPTCQPNVVCSLKDVRKVRRTDCMTSFERPTPTPRQKPVEPQVNRMPSVRCATCDAEFHDQQLLSMHCKVFHEEAPPGTDAASGQVTGGSEGESRFQCKMCSKAFKMKGSLKIHMRVVHLGHQKKNAPNATAVVPYDMPRAPVDSPIADDGGNGVLPATEFVYQASSDTAGATNLAIVPLPKQQHPHHATTIEQPNADVMQHAQFIEILDPSQLAQVIYYPGSGLPESNANTAVANVPLQSIPSPKDSSLPSSPQGNAGNNPKQWECDVCSKSFTTKYFLKKHKRLHTGEMPYSCHICSKCFTFQQSYHKHMLYHSDEKPHLCTICNRAFKELSTLHNHQRIHSGEKPFECETCGKCFRQRVSYLVHKRIHTGLMPYKCSGCDKSFRYKVSQRTHKCPATPPGTVERKAGDLLQKLLQSSSILPPSEQPYTENATDSASTAITDYKTPLEIKTEDYINRTLDELLRESYNKMGLGDSPLIYDHEQQQHHQQQHQQLFISSTDNENHAMELPDDSSIPRIESLCLLSPVGFEQEQQDAIESLKLDML